MISNKIIIKECLADTGSRASGAKLREMILGLLEHSTQIEVDFQNVLLTPSFADEAIGLLCHHLSLQQLNERIKFLHLSIIHKPLLMRVIANRFKAV